MTASLLALTALALSAPATPCPAGLGPTQDETLRALYETGRPFAEFLEQTRRRRDQWHAHYAAASVDPALLERAGAVGGTWRLLVIAEDWCGDSANTIPYLARLVEAVEGLDMRIVDSVRGRSIMRAHRTPDGRPATPTVLLLDASWSKVGCFIERPTELMGWYLENRRGMGSEELHEHMYAWYDEDGGAGTLADVVALLEAAGSGAPLPCPTGA